MQSGSICQYQYVKHLLFLVQLLDVVVSSKRYVVIAMYHCLFDETIKFSCTWKGGSLSYHIFGFYF